MSELTDYGLLTLGSYLRKISDTLYKSVDEIYTKSGLKLSSRVVPCLLLIKDNGQVPITLLASKLGQTHSAVSQMSRKLLKEQLIFDTPDPDDERKRLLSLTPKGYEYLDGMDKYFRAIQQSLDQMIDGEGEQLIKLLQQFEKSHIEQAFQSRALQSISLLQNTTVKVVDYTPVYRNIFKQLNIEWLEKYFYVEQIDEDVLSDPDRFILKPGGHIFIALKDNRPVGTAALIAADKDSLELSKMSVTESVQGNGIGRLLLEKTIEYFKKSGKTRLFLESNSKLKPALKLYESAGFKHIKKPDGDSHYQRADVYMEFFEPAHR
jgi:DNA-binding MarR family transcriptional regulator/GNAT superfamily N-acetyltransferase